MKDADIIDPEAGVNQSGLRDRNARVVLSFIRRHGAMPAAEIARRSKLSAQTVSNITRALLDDGLLLRGDTVKGKVGKPSVPVTLNPSGVHALGLNIGRRSAELVLVDFLGTKLDTVSTSYAYPAIDAVFDFLEKGMARIFSVKPDARTNLAGIGVARPGKMWEWLEIVNAPADAMRMWRDVDIGPAVYSKTGLETHVENDATSACVAEHLLGRGGLFPDFAYIFMGAFIGGGLVLNGRVVPGRSGNAAAIGPMPVPDGKGGMTELLNIAGLHVLERMLLENGLDPMELRRSPDDWGFCKDHLETWIRRTAPHLAAACASIASVVDVEATLIDGAMPSDVCARLTDATRDALDDLNLTMIRPIDIEQAGVGRNARSLGAALLPIHSRYFLV